MDGDIEYRWQRVLEVVKSKLQEGQFRTWFSGISPLAMDSTKVVLGVPNEYYMEWLRKNYLRTLRDAIRTVTGVEPLIEFRMHPSRSSPPATEPAQATPLPGSITLNAHYTFENFVVGQCNRLAHAAALAVVEAPGTAYNPLFLHGGVGLGKTHLLQAICHAVLARSTRIRVLYLSCETFMNQFISAIQHGDVDAFRERYRNTDILLIDDIHFLSRGESTQEEFFHTFNTLYNAQRQIILSSDSPPEEIPTLEQRLVSRFKWGLVSRLDPPDYETRVAIIQRKATLRGITLPDDVVHYIAERIETNIRELEGAINKITGYASLCGRKLDMALAREVLEDEPLPARQITMEDIWKVVTEYFGVRVTDLQSKKKSKSVAFPRQVCMYLARKLTRHSLQEIGGYLGGRDHTTVLYAEEKVRKLLEKDAHVRATVQEIESRLHHT